MPQNFQEELELRDATRLHNRALRTLNKNVKKKLDRVQREADETIAALFDAPSEAEATLFEIHDRFGLTCDPTDYTALVSELVTQYGH